MLRAIGVVGSSAVIVAASSMMGSSPARNGWSREQRAMLASLTLAKLEPLPRDPSNRVADDAAAAQFGRALFFDTNLSANGKVACATCHLPTRDFQDDIPLAHGVGVTSRRTMPIAGTAHSPWLFWDGRSDSQWSQALGPLESGVEHGGDRTQYAQYVAANYRQEYERLFGRLPELAGLPRHAGPNADVAGRSAWRALPPVRQGAITRVYANMGKAIAAFERRITLSSTRFDRYVDAELSGKAHGAADQFSADEEAGLKLFIGKANCTTCHNGARLTDDHFHNTGVPVSSLVAGADSGRTVGVRNVLAGEFNCLSAYSDAKPEDCSELRFAVVEGVELVRAFKTPSLRNVAERAPYMHAGQIATLAEAIEHYDRAPRSPFGKSELKRLKLSQAERHQIEAFLRTLTAPPTVLPENDNDHDTTTLPIVAQFGPLPSHHGALRGRVVDHPSRFVVNEAQIWVVRLESRDGLPLEHARVGVAMYMPETGQRGLSPFATPTGVRGEYALTGLRFDRAGWWNVALVIHHDAAVDSLAFNLIIN